MHTLFHLTLTEISEDRCHHPLLVKTSQMIQKASAPGDGRGWGDGGWGRWGSVSKMLSIQTRPEFRPLASMQKLFPSASILNPGTEKVEIGSS